MNRTIGLLILGILIPLFGFSAKPPTNNYNNVPRKQTKGIESNEAPGVDKAAKKMSDPEVRPEEAFKYGVQEFALIASDTGYFPTRIIVRRNIPVSIYLTGSSATNLCFMQDDFGIRRSVGAKVVEEIRFLPTKVGQYKFYCPVKEIKGTLIVRD